MQLLRIFAINSPPSKASASVAIVAGRGLVLIPLHIIINSGDAGSRTRIRIALVESIYERSCRLFFALSVPGNGSTRALIRELEHANCLTLADASF